MRTKVKVFCILLVSVLIVGIVSVHSERAMAQPTAIGNVKLGLSSTLAPGSCLELAADKFKEIVEKASNGHIAIVRYPSGELYGPKAEIEAVANGTVDMGVLHVAYVGGRSPALEFISSFGAQGCWNDYDHYWRFLDLKGVREIASSEFNKKINSELLGILAYGNSLFGNNRRPLHKVEDFKGLKVRTSGSGQAIMYRALGVVPTELSADEVYMALQRGTIDGATSGPSRWYLSKWYEVTPFLTQDNSLPYLSFWLAINVDTWKKLSAGDQKVLSDAGRQVEKWSREYVVKETGDMYKKLEESKKIKELYFFDKAETARLTQIAKPVMHDLIIKRAGSDMGNQLWGFLEEAGKK
jgi:TRAP-type C4-dicarboxylate transport system substrate-binding protein